MIRATTFVALSIALAGCVRFPNRLPKKDPPPPYGSVPPKPLGIADSKPATPPAPDTGVLIPPKPDASAPPPIVTPKPADPAAKNLADLKALLATANAEWNKVTTYELQLTRREINPKGAQNKEVLIFQFRREPMAVYTRNISGNGKGRETVYNPSAHEDKLYVKLGEGDNKLMPAGFVAPPVSPDDSRVKEKARYSIREAGFGRWIASLNRAVSGVEAGRNPADSIAYTGEVKRDEYPYPLVGVTQTLRAGDDPLFPAGGTRLYFFDLKPGSPSYGLPVLMTATDAAGKEVEYYLAEKVVNPANLPDATFNPSRLK